MKRILGSQRFLAVYSGVLTLVFAGTILGGFGGRSKKTTLEELDVQRINIVEPDATLRMVISDKTLFPGIIIKGKETPHPDRKTAGVLFFNDEGTENGGLIFGGSKDKDGKGSSYGHLSFDEYEQDQMFTIDSHNQGESRASALMMIDRPNYPISEIIALTKKIKDLPPEQQKREIANFSEVHGSPHPRLYLGRGDDKSVGLKLKDVDGKDRIIIQVAADGSPVLQFLNKDGKIFSQFPEATKK